MEATIVAVRLLALDGAINQLAVKVGGGFGNEAGGSRGLDWPFT